MSSKPHCTFSTAKNTFKGQYFDLIYIKWSGQIEKQQQQQQPVVLMSFIEQIDGDHFFLRFRLRVLKIDEEEEEKKEDEDEDAVLY